MVRGKRTGVGVPCVWRCESRSYLGAGEAKEEPLIGAGYQSHCGLGALFYVWIRALGAQIARGGGLRVGGVMLAHMRRRSMRAQRYNRGRCRPVQDPWSECDGLILDYVLHGFHARPRACLWPTRLWTQDSRAEVELPLFPPRPARGALFCIFFARSTGAASGRAGGGQGKASGDRHRPSACREGARGAGASGAAGCGVHATDGLALRCAVQAVTMKNDEGELGEHSSSRATGWAGVMPHALAFTATLARCCGRGCLGGRDMRAAGTRQCGGA